LGRTEADCKVEDRDRDTAREGEIAQPPQDEARPPLPDRDRREQHAAGLRAQDAPRRRQEEREHQRGLVRGDPAEAGPAA
jgi:hypothetical protein